MKHYKPIALLLCFLMVCSLLTGCSAFTNKDSKKENEKKKKLPPTRV